MCGRYEAGQKQKIAEAFHVSVTLDDIYFGLGVECAPGSIQPVIYVKDGERQVGEMRWGFKLPDRLLFNARSESMTSSSFWRERLHRRCIVPAGSFFEWQKTAPEPRPKYRLSVKGRPVLGMAGLWGPWQNPKTGKWEDTFAIITSDPNAKMGEIHNRQPVILEPREYAEWLEDSERAPVHLLRVLPEEDMAVLKLEATANTESMKLDELSRTQSWFSIRVTKTQLFPRGGWVAIGSGRQFLSRFRLKAKVPTGDAGRSTAAPAYWLTSIRF